MMKTRALRRQVYFKKIKNQKNSVKQLIELKKNKDKMEFYNKAKKLQKKIRVRCIEDKLTFEELLLKDPFSDDEITHDYLANKKNLEFATW